MYCSCIDDACVPFAECVDGAELAADGNDDVVAVLAVVPVVLVPQSVSELALAYLSPPYHYLHLSIETVSSQVPRCHPQCLKEYSVVRDTSPSIPLSISC